MTASAKRLFLALALLAAPLANGCLVGYTNLHPGENSSLYQHLFEDVITAYDEPYWLWVRGTISGDFDGNGITEEELVLATIQKGTEKNPGPIEMAFLVVCEMDKDGKRTALARTMLFDKSPIPDAPKPVNDIGVVEDRPFMRCRAQMVQDKIALKEMAVVYFWNDSPPSSVWYAGYSLEDGQLEKRLETVMWQSTPGFLTLNLDRSIEASPFGYQLVFGVAAIPREVSAKLGMPHEMPLWGHVYARDMHGNYAQADERFGDHYRKLEGAWNQNYLKALLKGLPAGDLAWFEYHMSLLNHYAGDAETARALYDKAKRNAGDGNLVAAIERLGEALRKSRTP